MFTPDSTAYLAEPAAVTTVALQYAFVALGATKRSHKVLKKGATASAVAPFCR